MVTDLNVLQNYRTRISTLMTLSQDEKKSFEFDHLFETIVDDIEYDTKRDKISTDSKLSTLKELHKQKGLIGDQMSYQLRQFIEALDLEIGSQYDQAA